MALDGYIDDTASFEDQPSLKNWKPSKDGMTDSDRNASGGFDCNICLDCVQDPVVTFCGHLYCWPCIYKWLHLKTSVYSEYEEQQKPQCPVCKSELSQSSLVPLYGRGQTKTTSEEKVNQVGIVVPQRPSGPRSYNATTVSQSSYQSYRHPQQFNSIPSDPSRMFSTSGSALDNTYGIFGEMIYARVFGNQVENMYTYPNSYNFQGSNNSRMRRHLMQVDKSLSRICFFLLCCLVLCLLLF
ncbi:E3 ubiquitin-protein ligase RMA1H1-like [Cicer arietinum]|uniref:E3 ubiquitin-protein ligase RMA n=1 Tax=Cicer arietinum TaxID=3827 RepID=A0A1S2YLD9_CICAR|nr:E3 ubiquitin-protein ligase RMA1H1-like [Cicer arietinum]XP_004506548.1 E3 ubiquitin-protein ligase RMA1H1-like [Cicer arietinum]